MLANVVDCVREVLAAAGDRRSPASASPTRPRPSSSGTGRPASPSCPPSSGNAAAATRRSASCATTARVALIRAQDRPRPRPHFHGLQAQLAVPPSPGHRRRAAPRRPSLRHGRLLADLEADRRRGACDRLQQRRAHHAVRHQSPRLGSRTVRAVRPVDTQPPRGAPLDRSRSATPARRCSGDRFPSRPRSATSRPRSSAMAASSRRRSRRPTAPAPSSGSTPAIGRTSPPATACLRTVAWHLDEPCYALEGFVMYAGAILEWLATRLSIPGGGIGVVEQAQQAGSSGGVILVPAFQGLAGPWWRPDARAALLGMTEINHRRPYLPRRPGGDLLPAPHAARRHREIDRPQDRDSARRRRPDPLGLSDAAAGRRPPAPARRLRLRLGDALRRRPDGRPRRRPVAGPRPTPRGDAAAETRGAQSRQRGRPGPRLPRLARDHRRDPEFAVQCEWEAILLRAARLAEFGNTERNEPYDLFVIGGGINGAAVACDAAGRGLSVALAEERDFAEGTSSRSSKLIHGGLRYLETYDFRLVREALREREILMAKTPHLVWPHSPGVAACPGPAPALDDPARPPALRSSGAAQAARRLRGHRLRHATRQARP